MNDSADLSVIVPREPENDRLRRELEYACECLRDVLVARGGKPIPLSEARLQVVGEEINADAFQRALWLLLKRGEIYMSEDHELTLA